MSTPTDDDKIEDLGLSARAEELLRHADIRTLGQLRRASDEEILSISGFGRKHLHEIYDKTDRVREARKERHRVVGYISSETYYRMRSLMGTLNLSEGAFVERILDCETGRLLREVLERQAQAPSLHPASTQSPAEPRADAGPDDGGLRMDPEKVLERLRYIAKG